MNKTNLNIKGNYGVYIVVIVAIVAFVGLLVTIMNGGYDSKTLSGYATVATCGDGKCARNEAKLESCAADCTAIDTDGDELYDWQETYGFYQGKIFTVTGPTTADTDGDGLSDGYEVIKGEEYGLDPAKYDSNGNGLSDYEEVYPPLSVMCSDTDGDSADVSETYTTNVKGTVYGFWDGIERPQSFTDTCIDSNLIYEGYCRTDGRAAYAVEQCLEGTACTDGACIAEVVEQAAIVQAPCTDTDEDQEGTVNLELKGTVTGQWYSNDITTTFTDSCHDTLQIKEGYCNDEGKAQYSTGNCPDGTSCLDGACV